MHTDTLISTRSLHTCTLAPVAKKECRGGVEPGTFRFRARGAALRVRPARSFEFLNPAARPPQLHDVSLHGKRTDNSLVCRLLRCVPLARIDKYVCVFSRSAPCPCQVSGLGHRLCHNATMSILSPARRRRCRLSQPPRGARAMASRAWPLPANAVSVGGAPFYAAPPTTCACNLSATAQFA